MMGVIVVGLIFVMKMSQQHFLFAILYAAFGFFAIGSVLVSIEKVAFNHLYSLSQSHIFVSELGTLKEALWLEIESPTFRLFHHY